MPEGSPRLRAASGYTRRCLVVSKNYESEVGSSSYHCSSFFLIISGVKLSKLENPVTYHRCIGE